MNKLATAIVAVVAAFLVPTAAGSPDRRVSLRIFECPGEGNFPIPGECSSDYFICVGGEAYPGTCPNGWIFDPELFKCVTPESASCHGTGPGSTTTRATSSTGASFSCPSANGNYAIPNTCGSDYYICVNGNAYPSTCPGGGIFDPESLLCVPPGSASCEGVTTPSGSTSTTGTSTLSTTSWPSTSSTIRSTTSPGGNFTCPEENGVFANPQDCGSYYACSNNVPILLECPPGLVFNPQFGYCDFPENVPGCEF